MPTLAEKELCTGCAACYNSCKYGAIRMQPNREGFLAPLIDAEKCRHCGACEKACPLLTDAKALPPDDPYACIARNKNAQILAESTSGGAFTAIAETILDLGGVVFGAAMDDRFQVKHIYVENARELNRFRNSKYVQSNIGDTFRECEAFLKGGRWVCYSGTPCQIRGLLHFLGAQYDKLITVDVMCHSVPSPLIFSKYIGYQRSKGKDFDTVVFRDKKRGYSYSNMVLKKGNLEIIRSGSELDPWFRIFLHAHSDRMSCFDCRAQKNERECDITLWDCWKVKELAPVLNDNKGATNCVAWTDKGKKIIQMAASKLDVIQVDYSVFAASLKRQKSEPRPDRQQFFEDANNMTDQDFIRKYFPESAKVRLKSLLRRILLQLRLHDAIRDAVHKHRS